MPRGVDGIQVASTYRFDKTEYIPVGIRFGKNGSHFYF